LKRVCVLVLAFGAWSYGAEPSAEDQAAMQETFRRYMRGINECRPDLRNAARVDGGYAGNDVATGMGQPFGEAIRAVETSCREKKPSVEIAANARELKMVTADTAMAVGNFRTIGLPEEKLGRVYLNFVRREGKWLLFFVRFYVLPASPTFLTPSALGPDNPPGADGWIALFDGQRATGFVDISRAEWPAGWRVEDGVLRAVAGGPRRSLRTRATYRDFEMRFEWKTPAKGNSGVKYRAFFLFSSPTDGAADATAFEYQLVDDQGDPGAIQHPVERTGALYNQVAPKAAQPRAVGQWNESAIVVRGRSCEHWLNGVKVMEYEAESSAPESPLVLQHHGTDMWFRNVRVRRLN
jgi:hypothetical protein